MTPEELDVWNARAKQAKVTPKEMQEKRPDLVRKPINTDVFDPSSEPVVPKPNGRRK